LLAVSVIVGDIPSSSPQGSGSDDLNLPGSGSAAGQGAAAVPLVPEVC
jgi:hypothetical protein